MSEKQSVTPTGAGETKITVQVSIIQVTSITLTLNDEELEWLREALKLAADQLKPEAEFKFLKGFGKKLPYPLRQRVARKKNKDSGGNK